MTAAADQADAADATPAASGAFGLWLRRIAVGAFVAVLAWAPFPLGGAVSWGAALQEIMIAVCWLLWLAADWTDPSSLLPKRRSLYIALVLVLAVLLWAFIQTLPGVPATWAHPIWQVASDGLGHAVPATISMNVWRTDAELLKLASAIAACWLACAMAQRSETAATLFGAVIVIGALYALYGFILLLANMTQAQLIYHIPIASPFLTGPFMLHNSFATYAGLATLAAVARLFHAGSETIISKRGLRQLVLSLIQFTFGRGAPHVIATIVLFAAVIASASRGGFAGTCAGFAAMAVLMFLLALRSPGRIWPVVGIAVAVAPIVTILVISGGQLGDRVDQLVSTGNADEIRLALWAATERMIADAPWRGLGLGTFQDAYPLYATQIFPYVMDKAHCDYLEFAAGIGLPAAITWWFAVAIAAFQVAQGALIRRRNRLYAVVATGATVLIAVHSAMDFSLQIPAVALSYATLMGIGLAQSARSAKPEAASPADRL